MREQVMNEWTCDYYFPWWEQQFMNHIKNISAYPHFDEVVKNLREVRCILNKSWDSWLYSFSPVITPNPPHPCPTRTSRTSHWEIFPGSVFVANPDWLPPIMGRRLVVPLTLANTMCLCTKYSDPLKKDQDQTSTFSPFHWDGKACICCNSDDLGLSWSYVFCDWGCWKGIQNSELWFQNCGFCESRIQCSVHHS